MKLEIFIKEMEQDLADFKSKYEAAAKANPEYYPLSVEEGNAGIWYELFEAYISSGEV